MSSAPRAPAFKAGVTISITGLAGPWTRVPALAGAAASTLPSNASIAIARAIVIAPAVRSGLTPAPGCRL